MKEHEHRYVAVLKFEESMFSCTIPAKFLVITFCVWGCYGMETKFHVFCKIFRIISIPYFETSTAFHSNPCPALVLCGAKVS